MRFDITTDLKIFKELNAFNELEKIYKRLPVTSCDGCGNCCYDSPRVTYIEALYILTKYLREPFIHEDVLRLFQKLLKNKLYGPIVNAKCGFISEDESCQIYKFAPLACKRWGLQTVDSNQKDISTDIANNKAYIDFYKSKGIIIPEEMNNLMISYCDKVKVEKNKYKIVANDIENYINSLVKKSYEVFKSYRTTTDYTICDFFLGFFVDNQRLYFDRIRLLKRYQNGEPKCIDEYIEAYDYKSIMKKFISLKEKI